MVGSYVHLALVFFLGSLSLTSLELILAARKIMSDGAGLVLILPEITILSIMSVVFLAIGAFLFSWTK